METREIADKAIEKEMLGREGGGKEPNGCVVSWETEKRNLNRPATILSTPVSILTYPYILYRIGPVRFTPDSFTLNKIIE